MLAGLHYNHIKDMMHCHLFPLTQMLLKDAPQIELGLCYCENMGIDFNPDLFHSGEIICVSHQTTAVWHVFKPLQIGLMCCTVPVIQEICYNNVQ